MKTMADVLRERGKLGPYPAPAESSPPEPDPAPEKPVRKRPREPLPPVDF